MTVSRRKRLAVLLSGRGSNLESILKATRQSDYPAEIVVVISDNSAAGGLKIAQEAGIAALACERSAHASKAVHEQAIRDGINQFNVDLICLAGYMRIFSADFVRHYQGRMINIHPSLLPKYKGLDTHQRAIDDGEAEHGCTVHYVNAEMDGGEIIAQAVVPVLAGDDAESLAARVLVEEHLLYPRVIRELCTD